uniref:Glutathione S-transferase n=1 Tax=Prorocentrum minimum TaxID=39449 RepID=T1P743_PROMN|nr:glutathione S-transferase [Prorocentrum minimum]AGO03486.1 microsomal glutathione S-transferase [Prorocentrum minimum]
MAFMVPDNFGYCVVAVGVSWFMNFFLSIRVMQARKEYGVDYPFLYAESTNEHHRDFNSVQRAHQNTLETWAPVSILCVVNGLAFPLLSTCFYCVWVLGRVVYGIGYSGGGPDGRKVGAVLSHLGDFPLLIMAFVSGFRMIAGKAHGA